MIIRTKITKGRFEITSKRGKQIKIFFPCESGSDCEVFIQFDNGSALGYAKPDDIEAYIAKTSKEFDEITTCENW